MHELLEQLRALESLDGIGDIADQIGTAYDDFSAGSETSISEKDAEIAAKDAEIQRLQAENYKLLTAAGAQDDGDDNSDAESEDPDEGDIIENLSDVIEED